MLYALPAMWLLQAIEALDNKEDKIIENQEKMLEELKEIKERLNQVLKKLEHVSAQIDEQILIGVRLGLRHLMDGVKSENKETRDDEFRLARAEFAKLTCLNPEGVTRGTSGEVPNTFLIGLGYLGSFHYFKLKGETRNALIQVYEFTQKAPKLGLSLFPPELFSKNYAELIEIDEKQLAKAIKSLEEQNKSNFWEGLNHFTKQTLRVTATALVAASGIVAGTATGGWLYVPTGYLAQKTFTSLEPSDPLIYSISPLEQQIQSLGERLQQYIVEVVQESNIRLQELNELKDESLNKNKNITNKKVEPLKWIGKFFAILLFSLSLLIVLFLLIDLTNSSLTSETKNSYVSAELFLGIPLFVAGLFLWHISTKNQDPI